jgi:hypothetical protein
MKKWFLLLAIVILTTMVYIVIPDKIIVRKQIIANCNINIVNRFLIDTARWFKWWPSRILKTDVKYNFNNLAHHNGLQYKVNNVQYSTLNVVVKNENDSLSSGNITVFELSQVTKKSIFIDWEFELNSGDNPFSRAKSYFLAVRIKNSMDTILDAFRSFAENAKSVYGADFHQTMSHDSLLVTMSFFSSTYPTTDQIYSRIDSIKEFISDYGGTEINFPMLNVSKVSHNYFKIMIGLSVNKIFPDSNRFIIKRFVPWKMVEGLVEGGSYTVEKSFDQLQKYRDENQLTFMAIPFQSLVTDRSKVQDTSRWLTKICAPIP